MVEVVAAATAVVVATAVVATADVDHDDSHADDDSFNYNKIYSRSTMINSSSGRSTTVDILVLVVTALL